MDRRATRPLATHAHRIRIRTPRRPRHSGRNAAGRRPRGAHASTVPVRESRAGPPQVTALSLLECAVTPVRFQVPQRHPLRCASRGRDVMHQLATGSGHIYCSRMPSETTSYRDRAPLRRTLMLVRAFMWTRRRVTAAELSRRGSDQQQRALVTARCPSSTAQPVSPATRHCAALGALGQAVPRPP